MCGSDIPDNGPVSSANPNSRGASAAADLALEGRIADAHCHPTDTPSSLAGISTVLSKATLICCMSTSFHDLDLVKQFYIDNPLRVVPAFGFHPWRYHEISSTVEESLSPSERVKTLLEPVTVGEDMDLALSLLASPTSPLHTWTERLSTLLSSHPTAILGEVGLDRAATVSGSSHRLRISTPHQLSIFETQLRIAGRLKRSASVHCVRAHGLMIDMFKRFGRECPDEFPLNVCMHSYNGEKDTIKTLMKIPVVGKRIYVSFSTVINGGAVKLAERIRAVPEDRILIESDYNTLDRIDTQMLDIIHVVAEARGWTPRETAETTFVNFCRFANIL